MTGMFGHYIRNPDGSIERCDDILEYAAWFEHADRQIALHAVPYGPGNKKAVMVSTVFLGINHSFSNDMPILFETITLDMPDDNELGQRYETETEALVGHDDTILQVQKFLVEKQFLESFSENFQGLLNGEPQEIPGPKKRVRAARTKSPQGSCSKCSGLGTLVNNFGMSVACNCTL